MGLCCKYVVHVLLPRTQAECQRSALAAVLLASSKRIKSLALQLIGGGTSRISRDKAISAITEALVTAAREGAF